MANIRWNDTTSLCIVLLDDSLWAPPSRLPKALPEATRFFPALDEAKFAVEQALAG